MATLTELAAMRQAIALSALGLGTTSPNPPVGCVILGSHGEVLATGYHQRKGEPHAEGHALRRAGERARGGTAVVTLEPCNHAGATPACRQLLLDAGVRRVVIAIIDSTSRGGGGAAALRAAGVDVEVGTLADEARVILHPWLTATQRHRPYVTLYLNHALAAAGTDSDLRAVNDLVIQPGGKVDEGIPAAHGPGVLTIPSAPFDDMRASETLKDIYQRGARTVLVVDDANSLAPTIDLSLVDRLVVDLPRIAEASEPQRLISEIPDRFVVTHVTTAGSSIRIDARHNQQS